MLTKNEEHPPNQDVIQPFSCWLLCWPMFHLILTLNSLVWTFFRKQNLFYLGKKLGVLSFHPAANSSWQTSETRKIGIEQAKLILPWFLSFKNNTCTSLLCLSLQTAQAHESTYNIIAFLWLLFFFFCNPYLQYACLMHTMGYGSLKSKSHVKRFCYLFSGSLQFY